MADALSAFTELLNKPETALGGRIVAGFAAIGIMCKLSEKLESILTDETKHDIARWLRVRSYKTGQLADASVSWPGTCASIFNRLFGDKHLSIDCFGRSAVASVILGGLAWGFVFAHVQDYLFFLYGSYIQGLFLGVTAAFTFNVLPDYVSLLTTRQLLEVAKKNANVLVILGILLADLAITVAIAFVPYPIAKAVTSITQSSVLLAQSDSFESDLAKWRHDEPQQEFSSQSLKLIRSLALAYKQNDQKAISEITSVTDRIDRDSALEAVMLPSVWTSIVLWLYGLSGFAIKVFRHLNLGLNWFNRRFDIEKKPLTAIGFVAGWIVALLYWSWAVFRHFHPA